MKIRKRQCKGCPWHRDINPDTDIPNGYCRTKHAKLESTIAKPGQWDSADEFRIMACHEAELGSEYPCVGWLVNQLGPGNNIYLRLLATDGRFKDLQTIGPQCESFEETLARDRSEPEP